MACWSVIAVAGGLLGPGSVRADDFVRITGDQFTLDGEVFKLKGSNYYPAGYMWANLWLDAAWASIQLESDMMRDFGINCVRILVPYSNGGWNGPNVPTAKLDRLEAIVNEFGRKGIRSNVTLFDWETSFPAAGTAKETDHYTYMYKIVDRLKNNPYVFLWDVKNEPDHPGNYGWCDCNPGACGDWDCNPAKRDQIVSWLNRMCVAIRARDPNHPVTAGMRWWQNLPYVIPFIDVAVFHSYWPNISSEEIPQTKGYMGANQKPILVQEWGWPSHPTPCLRDGVLIYDYNETAQLNLYVSHLTAIEQHNVAGGLQWMTFDAKIYSGSQTDSFENYFGLWYHWAMVLGLKPAGEYYRDHFPVNMFPELGDVMPPDPLINARRQVFTDKIRLHWTTSATPDGRGVMIRYGTTGYPAGPADGNLLYDGRGRANTPQTFEHTGVQLWQNYFYSLFAYDTSFNYADPVLLAAQPRPSGTVTGIVRDQYGQPVAGATVIVPESDPVTTNAGGAYVVTTLVGAIDVAGSKTYHAPDTLDGVTVAEGTPAIADLVLDRLPPDPVVSVSIESSSRTNTLEWTNPGSGNFAGTMIRFSPDAPPAAPTDGELLVVLPGAPQSIGQYTHTGLLNATTYYYAAFAYDAYAPVNYATATIAEGRPAVGPDFDRDGDVDLDDFGAFQPCVTGIAKPPTDPACFGRSFDGDSDVDHNDLAILRNCLSGEGVPADADCEAWTHPAP